MSKLFSKQIKYISLMILVLGTFIIISNSNYHIPGNQEGYQPDQPIKFSHQLHAGDLQVSCIYCHYGAEKSRHAGIPAMSICMNCHKYVTASSDKVNLEELAAKEEKRKIKPVYSPEILKIYSALALDKQLKETGDVKKPVEWIKIHNLPDHVFFSHKAHNLAGVNCGDCHGQIETMDKIKQVADLSMGWCLKCHRKSAVENSSAPGRTKLLLNCSTCHY